MDDRSTNQIVTNLKTARATTAPIEFVDIFGVSYYGYLTSINTQALERHADTPGAYPNIEMICNANFVEAT
jgi:hypothetical protein